MKQKLFGLFLVMAAVSFLSADQVSAAGCTTAGATCQLNSTTSGVCGNVCTDGECGLSCVAGSASSTSGNNSGSKCYDSFGSEVACTYDPATGASTASPIPGGNAASGTAASSAASSSAATSNKKSAVTDGAVQGLYIPRGSSIGLSDMPVTRLIENLMKWLLYIVGFVAIIAFVIAGLQYLLAGADSKMAEKAKESMTYAMIGVLVALSALIVIRAIQAVLSGSMIF